MQKLLATVTLSALLAACSSSGTASPDTADSSSAGSGRQPAAGNVTEKTISAPAAVAIDIVAAQTGAAPEQISIRSEEAVQFSDSSLGCPSPGMSYLQVITPGYKVLAEYGGKIYDVRVAGSRGMVCDRQATGGKTR